MTFVLVMSEIVISIFRNPDVFIYFLYYAFRVCFQSLFYSIFCLIIHSIGCIDKGNRIELPEDMHFGIVTPEAVYVTAGQYH